jgi:hypothetical protein
LLSAVIWCRRTRLLQLQKCHKYQSKPDFDNLYVLCWLINMRMLMRDMYRRSKKYWIDNSIDGSTAPPCDSFNSSMPWAIVCTTSVCRLRISCSDWQNLKASSGKRKPKLNFLPRSVNAGLVVVSCILFQIFIGRIGFFKF